MELKRKIATAIASGALLFSSFATSAFAATTLTITGNGSDSNNSAEVSTSNNTTVVQSNNANISNNVSVDAGTGNNEAKGNTGGDVSVKTGDATSNVTVTNAANSNSATVDCCNSGNTDVTISGNGADSENNVELEQSEKAGIGVYQTNNADINNKVNVDANTGDNEAKDNTGGTVSIKTGDVITDVTVSNAANMNSAQVGGNGSGGGILSAWITGNGEDSENKINLELGNSTVLKQTNNADISNKVNVDANTGDNEAKDNTGGDVTVETGDATATIGIDNMVNFNEANVDCGCLLSDLTAKIAGNGTDSENKIEAELGGGLEAFQTNCAEENGSQLERGDHHSKCGLDNIANADGNTGDNNAKDNTGDPGGDPTVTTGDSNATIDLSNTGNANVFGDAGSVELPTVDFNLDLSLDLHSILGLLGLLG